MILGNYTPLEVRNCCLNTILTRNYYVSFYRLVGSSLLYKLIAELILRLTAILDLLLKCTISIEKE